MIPTIDRTASWYGTSSAKPLVDQLEDMGIDFDRCDIPEIVGMNGCAYWIQYISPNTGDTVTVLCVPIRSDVDSFSEDYYYIFGLTYEEAQDVDWVEVYDNRPRPKLMGEKNE